jgi:hypothetical protein
VEGERDGWSEIACADECGDFNWLVITVNLNTYLVVI